MYVKFEAGQKWANTNKELEFSDSIDTFADCGYVLETNDVVIDIDIDDAKNKGLNKNHIVESLKGENIETQLVETTRGYHAYFTYDLKEDEKFISEGVVTIGNMDFLVEFKSFKSSKFITAKLNGVPRTITNEGKRMTLPSCFLDNTIKKRQPQTEIIKFDGTFDFDQFHECTRQLKAKGHFDAGGNYHPWHNFVAALVTMVKEGRIDEMQAQSICTLVDCGDKSTYSKYASLKNDSFNMSYGYVVKLMKANGINEITKVSIDNNWLGSWERKLEADQFGNNKPTRTNLVTIFENDSKLVGRLAYNQFTGQIEVKDDLPWTRVAGTKKWEDSDEECLRVYLDGEYGISSKDVVSDALKAISYQRSFHPVKDYFNGLPPWDGVTRVKTLFIDYLGIEDNELNRKQTEIFFQAVVTRTFEAGCKWDYVVLFKGSQGLGKSSFIRHITPSADWYTDSIENVEGKDAVQSLRGKLIIEFGELAAMSKKEAVQVKGFLTRQVDEYRPSYGRHNVVQPRQCVFIGTTNEDQPLKDETGGRRWWIMEATKKWFEQEELLGKIDITQVWAEAFHLYTTKVNDKLVLPKHLEELANDVQREHTSMGVYEGEIVAALDNGFIEARRWDDDLKTMLDCGVNLDRICAKQLWEIVLIREPKDMRDSDVKRINAMIGSHRMYEKKGRSEMGKYGKVQTFNRVM